MTNSRTVTPACEATSCTGSTRNPIIAQQQLARYQQLAASERERRALRHELLALLAAGASVEPGRLTVYVRRSVARRLNQKTLRGIFTKDELGWIKSAIEPTPAYTVVVRPDPNGVSDLELEII